MDPIELQCTCCSDVLQISQENFDHVMAAIAARDAGGGADVRLDISSFSRDVDWTTPVGPDLIREVAGQAELVHPE